MFKTFNEYLSFILELTMLAALAYTGFHFGEREWLQYVLGIGLPVVVIIFWAKRMAPKASKRFSYPWILIITLALFELAAFALYFAGAIKWAIIFAIVALVNVGMKFIPEDQK